MKCEGCGIATSVATYSPDSTGLMCWWCTDCTAKTSVGYPRRTIAELEARIAALKAALVEACEIAAAQGSFHPDEADRIAELRKLAGEP